MRPGPHPAGLPETPEGGSDVLFVSPARGSAAGANRIRGSSHVETGAGRLRQTSIKFLLLVLCQRARPRFPCCVGTRSGRRSGAVGLGGPGNRAKRLGRPLRLPGSQVSERQQADDVPISIDDRHAPHLQLAHPVENEAHILVRPTGRDIRRQDLLDALLARCISSSGGPDHDVAVGDDSNQACVEADRQNTDVQIVHEPGRIAHCMAGLDRPNV